MDSLLLAKDNYGATATATWTVRTPTQSTRQTAKMVWSPTFDTQESVDLVTHSSTVPEISTTPGQSYDTVCDFVYNWPTKSVGAAFSVFVPGFIRKFTGYGQIRMYGRLRFTGVQSLDRVVIEAGRCILAPLVKPTFARATECVFEIVGRPLAPDLDIDIQVETTIGKTDAYSYRVDVGALIEYLVGPPGTFYKTAPKVVEGSPGCEEPPGDQNGSLGGPWEFLAPD